MEIKTKFNLGDNVWCLFNQKAVSFEVKKIFSSVSTDERFTYNTYMSDELNSKISVEEKDVYASKDELRRAVFGDDEND